MLVTTVRLPFSELHATYRVVTPFRLPHHSGSLLRGVLGRALRLTSCTASPACATTCERPTSCTYARLFDPPLPHPPPHKLLRGSTQAPPPLLPLIPAPGVLELHPGDSFMLGVRVLGHLDATADQHLTQALERLPELGLGRDEGRLATQSITHHGALDRVLPPPALDAAAAVSGAATPQAATATLTLETPAWIEQDKRLVTSPDFRTLFRTFNRRITSLCALYGELAPDDEARYHALDALCDEVLVRSALHPVRWERHSLERDERHPMKGLLGTLALEGNLAPFIPTLQLAALTHVGKATSHGLGRIGLTLG
jgi:CRISPR-associated endoribonuclease Cas6